MKTSASPRNDYAHMEDLSSLLKQYLNADGVINPDRAPPDMKVVTHPIPLLMTSSTHVHFQTLEMKDTNDAVVWQDLLIKLQDVQKLARTSQQAVTTVTPEPGWELQLKMLEST